jgi:alpha-tubulin suppressor-like RCC1 family protein
MNLQSIIKAIGAISPLLLASGGYTQEVLVWGTSPQYVPASATNVIGVAAANNYSIALRGDGSLIAWGSAGSFVPPEATNVVKVVAGPNHIVALKGDGKVVSWLVGTGGVVMPPDGTEDIVDISAGESHSLALKSDGTVIAWGDNAYGKCAIPPGLGHVVAISAGAGQSVALLQDASLISWGRGPQLSSPAGEFMAMAASPSDSQSLARDYTLAIRPDGTVASWGTLPVRRWGAGESNVVSVVPQEGFALGLRSDGTVFGTGVVGTVGAKVIPSQATNIVVLAASVTHAVALKCPSAPRLLGPIAFREQSSAGALLPLSARVVGAPPMSFQWFANGVALPGTATPYPRIVGELDSSSTVYRVVVSNAFGAVTSAPVSFVISPVSVWGDKARFRVGVPADLSNVVGLDAGAFHVLAVNADGTVNAWGQNRDGQTNTPTAATNVVAVSAGSDHSLALKADGTVIGWGRNWDGQTDVPAAATNVVAISAGWAHSLALRSDGTVVAWGNNVYDQTEVSMLASHVTAIAAGYYHNVALLQDGRPVTWGTDYEVPPAATNVVAVAAGWEFSLALRANGTVVAWGDNSYGQLDLPANLTNVVAITAGYYHGAALCADGAIVSWGRGNLGVTNSPALAGGWCAVSAGEDFQVGLASVGAPRFGVQPQRIVASLSGQAILKGNVITGLPATFQWLRDGVQIAGATNHALVLSDAQISDGGVYTLVASNAFGQATSQPVTLAVQSEAAVISIAGGWGRNAYGQLNAFQATKSPIEISAGGFHGLAVNADGTVGAWGKSRDGQTIVPANATNVVHVAAGANHSLALRADDTVIAWGRNWDGQTNVPPMATNVIRIAAGSAHSLALNADGTVLAWGNNDYDQTNVPSSLNDVVAIAAGYYHNLALRSDGTVAAWGLETYVPETAKNVVTIAAGWWHSLAVRADGSVIAWGDNRYGECDVPASATNVVAVSAGWGTSFAVRSDGTVVAWGRDQTGLMDVPAGLQNVVSISAGEDYSLVLVQHGTPTAVQQNPVAVHIGADAVLGVNLRGTTPLRSQWYRSGTAISGATDRYLLIDAVQLSDAGDYTLWVTNATGQVTSETVAMSVLANPEVRIEQAPRTVVPGGNTTLAPVVYGEEPMTFQWMRDGVAVADSVHAIGANSRALTIITATKNESGLYSLIASNVHGLFTSGATLVAVTPVLAWGDNSAGQLEIPASTFDAANVAAGAYHNLAVLTNGMVVGWGENASGQTTAPESLANVVAVAAGESHSLALKADGSIVAWGSDQYRQLQIPTTVTQAVAIAAGAFHTLALGSDGKVIAWGDNNRGQSTVPISATNVVRITAGREHSLALQADGTVVSWGNDRTVPADLSNVVAIAAGDFHSAALRSDGSVVTWGKLSLVDHSVPAEATNVIAIAAGGDHTLAMRQDGVVIAWGANYAGEGLIPSAATNILSLAAGGAHNVSLTGAALPTIPRNYQVSALDAIYLTDTSGAAATTYQWFHGGELIPGGTNRFLLIARAQSSDAGSYELVATDLAGRETRQKIEVTVTHLSPYVYTESTERVVTWGDTISLEPIVGGEEPLGFQWQFGDSNLVDNAFIAGAATQTLCITNIDFQHSGAYSLAAWNSYGSTTNLISNLTVSPVVAWGTTSGEVTNVPASTTNVVAVAAGAFQALGLRSDGTVAVWGTVDGAVTNAVFASNAVAVASGYSSSSLALTVDGHLIPWGTRLLPDPVTNVVAVANGDAGTFAVLLDGTVIQWTNNGWLSPVAGTNFVDVAAGGKFLALQGDGTVRVAGTGSYEPPATATNVVAIAAGTEHYLALRSDGTVIAWGANAYGATDVPDSATNIVAIRACRWKSLALRADGTAIAWGKFAWDDAGPDVAARGTNLTSIDMGYMFYVGLRGTSARQELTTRFGRIVEEGGSQLLLAPKPGLEVAHYQWQFNGANIPGATKSFLEVKDFQAKDEGTYRAFAVTPFRTLVGPPVYLGKAGAPLRFEPLPLHSTQGANAVGLRLLGTSGSGPVVVESSGNFVDWAPILTNAPWVGPLDVFCGTTNGAVQFFRAVEQR